MNRIEAGRAAAGRPLPVEEPIRSKCTHRVNRTAQLTFVMLATFIAGTQLAHIVLPLSNHYYTGYRDLPKNQEEGIYDFLFYYPFASVISLVFLSSTVNMACEQITGRRVTSNIVPAGVFLGTLFTSAIFKHYLTQADQFNHFVEAYDQHPDYFRCLETLSNNISQFFNSSKCRSDIDMKGICEEQVQPIVICGSPQAEFPSINISFDTPYCNDWSSVSDYERSILEFNGVTSPAQLNVSKDMIFSSPTMRCGAYSARYSRIKYFSAHLCSARTLEIDSAFRACATEKFFIAYNEYLDALEANHLADKRPPKFFMKWVTLSGDRDLRIHFIRVAILCTAIHELYFNFVPRRRVP